MIMMMIVIIVTFLIIIIEDTIKWFPKVNLLFTLITLNGFSFILLDSSLQMGTYLSGCKLFERCQNICK